MSDSEAQQNEELLASTRKATAAGAGWMVATRLLDRAVSVLSTVILARLLLPSDYGIVAMAAGCSELLYLIVAFGFDSALIQRSDATHHHYDTAWTLNALLGVALAAGLAAGAPLAALYFGEPRLTSVLMVLAVSPLLNGLSNIGIVKFRKELQFHREAIFITTRRLLGFLVTMAAAFALRNYWALIIGMVATSLFGLLLSYVLHPYRPRFNLSEFHALFAFSAWLQLNNIIRFGNTRALEFVVAKIAGTVGLGLYSLSNEISNLPTTDLSAPINRALFPSYARFQHDDVFLRRIVLEVFAALGMIAIPAGVGVACIADLLVPVALGDKWLAAIPLVQVLAIAGVVAVMQNNSYLIYLVKGQPKITTWVAGGFGVVQILLVAGLLQHYGLIGAAYGVLAARLVFVPVELYMLMRTLSIRVRELATVLIRPLVSTVMMGAATHALALRALDLPAQARLLALLTVVATGAMLFIVTIMLQWRLVGAPDGGERLIFKLLPGGAVAERWAHRLLLLPPTAR